MSAENARNILLLICIVIHVKDKTQNKRHKVKPFNGLANKMRTRRIEEVEFPLSRREIVYMFWTLSLKEGKDERGDCHPSTPKEKTSPNLCDLVSSL